MNEQIDIIEIDEDKNDIFEETYDLIEKRLNILDLLNKKINDYELLKIEYQTLEDEIVYLKEKKKQLIIKNDNLNKEIKDLKTEIMDQKKKMLMLKALIKLMIKNYGIESVSKVTNLSLDQIKKYLN